MGTAQRDKYKQEGWVNGINLLIKKLSDWLDLCLLLSLTAANILFPLLDFSPRSIFLSRLLLILALAWIIIFVRLPLLFVHSVIEIIRIPHGRKRIWDKRKLILTKTPILVLILFFVLNTLLPKNLQTTLGREVTSKEQLAEQIARQQKINPNKIIRLSEKGKFVLEAETRDFKAKEQVIFNLSFSQVTPTTPIAEPSVLPEAPSPTPTATPVLTPVLTSEITRVPPVSSSPTLAPTMTPPPTSTVTPILTPTFLPTVFLTPTPTTTPTFSPTPTLTAVPTPTVTPEPFLLTPSPANLTPTATPSKEKEGEEITWLGKHFLVFAREPSEEIKEVIRVELFDSSDNKVAAPILVKSISSEEVEISVEKSRAFHPGKYVLKVTLMDPETEEVVDEVEQDFTWGVLAINTNKSIFLPDETAYLQMAVLNDYGHTLCDAPLRLEIQNSQSEKGTLTTEDGTIIKSETCGANNVTDTPDYYAFYKAENLGSYHLKLTNLENGYEIEDSFEVKESVPFEVERIGATRINPFLSNYWMTFNIKANQDFVGEMIEKLPSGFEVIEAGEGRVENTDLGKEITWNLNLSSGQQMTLQYEYKAPEISPQIFLLGPLRLSSSRAESRDSGQAGQALFEEARQWQIAADAGLTYVGGNTGTGTGSTYSISLTALSGGSGSTALAGDIVIVVTGWASATDGNPGVTTSGYTELADLYKSDTRDANLSVNWKIMGSTPDTSVTVSGYNNAANGGASVVHVWRGVDPTTPIDVTTTTATAGNAALANAPAITPITSGAVVLACGLGTGDATPTAMTMPSGMSNPKTVNGVGTTMSAIAGIASYAWSSGAYDPAAWTGGESTTSDSWVAATLALRPGITVSGGCFTDATEGTACTDDGSNEIKVAINGVLQAASDITVDGSWSFTITKPASGAVMVFFINGEATESEEATTVTKYDGSGDVDLVKMYQSQLVIGTDTGSANSDQTVAISDLDTTTNGYEWSDDEDVLFDVTVGSDLTVDANNDKTETLYIISGDIYRPASAGGGDTTTHHLDSESTITADSNAISVAGNFTNTGTFTANTSTVTFNGGGGSTQAISGNTTFSGFTATATSARTLQFAASSVTAVTGTWIITGSSGQLITLTTSSAPTQWTINPTAASVSYADINYSNNTGTSFCATYSQSTNDNNTNWSITSGASCNTAPNSPTSLAQKKTDDSTIATGGWINQTSVKFTATASDPDSSDTLYLCVEKDILGTGFSNTEDSCGTGVAYSGTPVTVTVTITGITDTNEYHWQARVKDAASAYSSWVSYPTPTPNAESERDFGLDTTAPTGGTIYDGTETGVDKDFNDGSLSSLSANWSGFDTQVSGLNYYEYSIGTTAGGTDVKGWTNNSTTTSVTATGLTLQTSQVYHFNVRAIDNAGNAQSPVISSDGQVVNPSLSFSLSPSSVTFANLNSTNSYTDTKTTTLTTSTNAYNGYAVRVFITDYLKYDGSIYISDFNGGTYANPDEWLTDDTGFGYTSNDTTIQGVNKFNSTPCPGGGNPSCYAPFSQTPPGDIAADHTDTVSGSPISNEQFTITYKVKVTNVQQAKPYSTTAVYTITAQY